MEDYDISYLAFVFLLGFFLLFIILGSLAFMVEASRPGTIQNLLGG